MLDLLKLGFMNKPEIESKLPQTFISLHKIISKILSDNGISLPAKEESKESQVDNV